MELRSLNHLGLAILVAITFFGCAKKSPPSSQTSSTTPTTIRPDGDDTSLGEEFVPAPVPQTPLSSDTVSGFQVDDQNYGLQRIHFEYDRAIITPEARQVLERNASFLRANQQVSLEIQGHCDERGSRGYNIALGERRAQTATVFLRDLGISPARLVVNSYGEDKPLALGHTEYDFALNRRVEFMPQN